MKTNIFIREKVGGKWEVKSFEEGSRETFLRINDEYHIVGGRGTIAIMGQGWDDDKAEANAQLIAESPRMAELIKRMVEGGDSQSIAMEAREIVKTLGLKVEK